MREGDVEIELPPVPKESADPAQVRTLPPQDLQARHDRVLFQTAWDRIGQAKLVSSPTDTTSIDGVPWRWRWLAVWETAFALEVDHATRPLGSTTPDETVAAYARWAFKLFRNRIRSGCDLRVMRNRITTALALVARRAVVAVQG